MKDFINKNIRIKQITHVKKWRPMTFLKDIIAKIVAILGYYYFVNDNKLRCNFLIYH